MDNNTLIEVVNLINSQINNINVNALNNKGGLTEAEAIGAIASRNTLKQLRDCIDYMIAKEATKEDFIKLFKKED